MIAYFTKYEHDYIVRAIHESDQKDLCVYADFQSHSQYEILLEFIKSVTKASAPKRWAVCHTNNPHLLKPPISVHMAK
jgi:hypothetical protein